MSGPRYPKASWVPWKPADKQGRATYYRGQNRPEAVILHIMAGHASTARQWASEGHYGASFHFTVARDGSVMQHLDFEDGGYHAGITAAQAKVSPPIWHLWKGPDVNVNHYTIGIEHEGFPGEDWPEPQRLASRDLCYWLAPRLNIPTPDQDTMVAGALGPGDRYLLHYPPHAAIDRINRPNDFDTLVRRAAFYQWLKQGGDDLTPDEVRAIVREEIGKIVDDDVDDRLRKVMGAREAMRRLASHPKVAVVEAAWAGAIAAVPEGEL